MLLLTFLRISLTQKALPSCLKTAIIVPVLKKSATPLPAWTITSMHSEQSGPQRMPYPLPVSLLRTVTSEGWSSWTAFRFLEIIITENLSGSSHITNLVDKKPHKWLHHPMELKKAKFSTFQREVLIKFYREAIESVWDWENHSPGEEGSAVGGHNCPEHQWYRRRRMSALSSTDTEREHPPQPQSVHPAAIWQEMERCPLPYRQLTEQLLSSGCETPELILNYKKKKVCFSCVA